MKKRSPQETPQHLSVADLILFSVYSVLSEKEVCDFERLVKECFKLFPDAFCFSKYPKWPDARKLDRPLRFLRDKKLITGDPQTSFDLTKLGKKTAEEISRNFRQKKLFK